MHSIWLQINLLGVFWGKKKILAWDRRQQLQEPGSIHSGSSTIIIDIHTGFGFVARFKLPECVCVCVCVCVCDRKLCKKVPSKETWAVMGLTALQRMHQKRSCFLKCPPHLPSRSLILVQFFPCEHTSPSLFTFLSLFFLPLCFFLQPLALQTLVQYLFVYFSSEPFPL